MLYDLLEDIQDKEIEGLLQSAEVINIKPDDIIVIKLKDKLTEQSKERIVKSVMHVLTNKVIVLDAGIEMQILRHEQ